VSEPLKEKDLGEIEVAAARQDFDLSDRYQSFSSELLRLSLLMIAGVGFLIANVLLALLPKAAIPAVRRTPLSGSGPVFSGLAASLVCLGLSTAAALTHRYLATDGLAYHLKALRLIVRGSPGDEDRAQREKAPVQAREPVAVRGGHLARDRCLPPRLRSSSASSMPNARQFSRTTAFRKGLVG
jgi:hypothetical protein